MAATCSACGERNTGIPGSERESCQCLLGQGGEKRATSAIDFVLGGNEFYKGGRCVPSACGWKHDRAIAERHQFADSPSGVCVPAQGVLGTSFVGKGVSGGQHRESD